MIMKKFINLCLIVAYTIGISSCSFFELDNFDGPDAKIFGGIYDSETNELVEQDMANGTKIRYQENGWDNPVDQEMICKVDGTYRNNIFFAANYTFKFDVARNFRVSDPQTMDIHEGDNEVNFFVTPFVRIRNVRFEMIGAGDPKQLDARVKATFEIQTTDKDYVINQLGLFVHTDWNVSNNIRLNDDRKCDQFGLKDDNPRPGAPQAGKYENWNHCYGDTEWHEESIVINLWRINGYKARFKDGHDYYFRVGALVKGTDKNNQNIGGGNVRYNFAPAQKLTFHIGPQK